MKKTNIELKKDWVKVYIPPGIKTISGLVAILDVPDNHYQYELGEIHVLIGAVNDTRELVLDESNCETFDKQFHYRFEQVFDVSGIQSIEFRHMKVPRDYSGRCKLGLVLSEVPIIEIHNPLLKFDEHLKQYDNSKVIFSAPFGEGKTTFLDYFFDQNKLQYEVFKVFPVNYSVASNEDIFKYIKSDILFQLLGKELDLNEVSTTILESFKEYIYLNPKKTLYSFLNNVSHLNSTLGLITESVEGLNNFIAPILEYHEGKVNGNRTKAEEYVKEIYQKEGSLFEDNFYSQLIRELLTQITEKKTVLVIEDLDRIDPEHVFRILNVISAHYDSYNYDNSSTSHNKFGFDKIIVVCDVRNIKSIFEHRYGSNVDFNGYFNKFFSTKPFAYNNKEMLSVFARNIYIPERLPRENHSIEALVFLLDVFIQNDMISLRELIKLKVNSFNEIYQIIGRRYNNKKYYELEKNVFIWPLFYLNEYFDIQLNLKLDRLKNLNLSANPNYDYWSRYLMAGLAEVKDRDNDNVGSFKYLNENYTITRQRDINFDYWRATDIYNSKNERVIFTEVEFCILISETFNRMKKL